MLYTPRGLFKLIDRIKSCSSKLGFNHSNSSRNILGISRSPGESILFCYEETQNTIAGITYSCLFMLCTRNAHTNIRKHLGLSTFTTEHMRYRHASHMHSKMFLVNYFLFGLFSDN